MMRGSTSYSISRTTTCATTASIISTNNSSILPSTTATLSEQRRHSTRYLSKMFVETRQPQWLAGRQEGVSFTELEDAKTNRCFVGRRVKPRASNIFPGDTNPDINPFMQPYQLLHEMHAKLLGRKASLTSVNTKNHVTQLAPWELENDLRFRGRDRPMISNLFYERSWNQIIEQLGAQQHSKAFRFKPASKAIAQKAETAANDLSEENVRWWWDEMVTLLQMHQPAVGEFAPGRARNIRKVQEHFVKFTEAINSFQFQDGFMANYLWASRPKEAVVDLYGTFLEMEANRIDPNYCARCGQSTHATAFCGQGDAFSLYRKWRGRPARHKPWAKEWLEAAANRGEALWHRAAEDPFFGNAGAAFTDPAVSNSNENPGYYTQKQAEEMLRIYCLTKQRGRANAFMVNILGSREYTFGQITVSENMQKMYDELLATTAHPHMLTNANGAQPAAASRYIPGIGGNTNAVSQSPAQLRIDMEVAKIRREQKEEGVVRIPPKDWQIDTKSIVAYKTDPKTGLICNWEEVRQSIEKSFLSSGLPETAWMAHELREMKYLEDRIQTRVDRLKKLDAESTADRDLCKKNPTKFKLFPDAETYRAFDVKSESIGALLGGDKKFSYGDSVLIRASVFPAPENVPVKIGSSSLQLNTTDEICTLFGDFVVGMKVRCQPAAAGTSHFDALILGVEVSGSPSEWNLVALKLGSAEGREVVSLGVDLADVRAKYSSVQIVGRGYGVPELDQMRSEREFFNGFIIGVRNENLYVQLDEGVAVPLGRRELVSSTNRYDIRLRSSSSDHNNNNNNKNARILQEPSSWNIPFRNDNSERRLGELKKAPWLREDVAPLIANGYTPKEKRFGYTQHITQDDFMTGEYRDRLLARQYFTNAQKFRVIPDRMDQAASFNGKSAFVRTQGFPSVDRRELEDGWAYSPSVPKYEIEAVEQALRDISGTRPGNFIRTPEEAASVELEENWWKRANPHWKQKQDEDSFEHAAHRRNIDAQSLPFGGEVPLAGATMGIGDRLKETLDDLSRSFDVGPHGHSAGSNTGSAFDTLDSQRNRSALLSAGDTLREIFVQRLKVDGLDTTTFVVSRNGAGVDPKILLISLNEWMEHGKAPSLVLVRVLQRYLARDLAAYNASVPEGVQQLSIDALTRDGVVSLALCNTSPWSNRQSSSYRKTLAKFTQSGKSHKYNTDSWLIGFYVQQKTILLPGDDADLRQSAFENVSQELLARLRGLIGKNLEEGVMRNHTFGSKKTRTLKDAATTPLQLVRSTEVAQLLLDIGVPSEQRSLFMQTLWEDSLRNSSVQDQSPHDFITNITTILTIENIERARTIGNASSASSAAANSNNNSNVASLSVAATIAAGPTTGGSSMLVASSPLFADAPVVPAVLDRLMLVRDGYAADLLYMARENKKRSGLFEEFCRLAYSRQIEGVQKLSDLMTANPDYLAVKSLTRTDLLHHFNNYCDGKWAPRADEAVDLIAAFVKTSIRGLGTGSTKQAFAPTQQQEEDSASPLAFFTKLRTETTNFLFKSGQAEFQGQRRAFFDIEMPSLDDIAPEKSRLPFEFDNIVAERRETLAHYAEWTPNRRSGAFYDYVPLLPTLSELSERASGGNNNNNNNGATPNANAGGSNPTTTSNTSIPQTSASSATTFQYGITPAYITVDNLYGLDTKILQIAESTEEGMSAQLREDLRSFAKDPNSISKLANRVLNRCFPVLKVWNEAIKKLQVTERQTSRAVQQNANTLETLNRAVDDAQQEQDFRQNAERYWKKAIDTGGALNSGDRMGNNNNQGGNNFNNRGNNNNRNRDNNNQNQGDSGLNLGGFAQGQHRKFNVNLGGEGKGTDKTPEGQQQRRNPSPGNNNNNDNRSKTDAFRGLGRNMNNQRSPSPNPQGGRGRGSGGSSNNNNNNRSRSPGNSTNTGGRGGGGRGLQ